MQQPVVFHVSNDWFDGIASFQLAPDAASYTALLSCFKYFNISYVVTAISKIHITTLGCPSRLFIQRIFSSGSAHVFMMQPAESRF